MAITGITYRFTKLEAIYLAYDFYTYSFLQLHGSFVPIPVTSLENSYLKTGYIITNNSTNSTDTNSTNSTNSTDSTTNTTTTTTTTTSTRYRGGGGRWGSGTITANTSVITNITNITDPDPEP
jgi:hypothetical protein